MMKPGASKSKAPSEASAAQPPYCIRPDTEAPFSPWGYASPALARQTLCNEGPIALRPCLSALRKSEPVRHSRLQPDGGVPLSAPWNTTTIPYRHRRLQAVGASGIFRKRAMKKPSVWALGRMRAVIQTLGSNEWACQEDRPGRWATHRLAMESRLATS